MNVGAVDSGFFKLWKVTVIFLTQISISAVAIKLIFLNMFLFSHVLGDHTKITLNTRNVFIECTGTDITKVN